MEETRTLISLFSILTVKRPSCGIREVAMSMFARILMREMMGRNICLGGAGTSWRRPSMRNRTWTFFIWGLMWMSLAPSRTAWEMIEFTRRTMGASSAIPMMELGLTWRSSVYSAAASASKPESNFISSRLSSTPPRPDCIP